MIKKNKNLIIILFIIAHAVFLVMNFIQPLIVTGVSVKMFDLMMFKGYDLAYATTFVNEISQQGKNVYLFVQVPLDFIYPLLVSAFFYLFFLDQTRNKKIASLGFVSMVFDYMENIFVIVILTTVNLTDTIVGIASIATIIKGGFYVINYGLVVYLLIRCRYRMGCPFKNEIKKDKNNAK